MSFFDNLRNVWAKKKLTVKVAWLGLDHAGKTTLIERITKNVFKEEQTRTLGMNIDQFESGGISFLSWDIGGQETFRDTLWDTYITGAMGIIFVIDSSDSERFPEAKKELWDHVFENPSISNIPILVLANKQDLPEAASAGKVALSLGLHKVTKHSYAIVPVSAKNYFNVEEALEWLRQRITEKIKEI